MRAHQGFALSAGLLAAMLWSAGAQGAPGAKAACELLAKILVQMPYTALESFPGSVTDPVTGSEHAGCRVELRGNFDRSGDAQDPLAPISPAASALNGWSYDHRYAADGKDGSAFALRRDRVLCLVRGSWDGGDDRDPDYEPEDWPGDWYEISVGCAAN